MIASSIVGQIIDWRLTISAETRLYTDEEIAMILREAAQSADSSAATRASSFGLSLEQIKAAAAEADLDPALVEHVALRIAQRGSESFFERAAGGPVRHRQTIRLPTMMSEKMSAHLLSAIRAAAEVPGEGRADASGFSWHAWRRSNRISVTAHEDSRGTRIQILVDRTQAMVMTVFVSQLAVVMPTWMLIEAIDSFPDLLAWAVIPTGVLAAARAFWKSSSRSIRERTAVLLDAVRESLPAEDTEGGVQEAHDLVDCSDERSGSQSPGVSADGIYRASQRRVKLSIGASIRGTHESKQKRSPALIAYAVLCAACNASQVR